jgi:diadenosine tetraphosphate (Ap4A) HIT family hydrolase
MNEFTIFETNHWIISHRMDSCYPGFLIASTRNKVPKMTDLSKEVLEEMGPALCEAEKLLHFVYQPYKTIIGKFGFMQGFNFHFHILPVTNVVLQEMITYSDYANKKPDGIDAITFICRKYCEKPLNNEQLKEMMATIKMLRIKYQEAKS